MIYLTENDLISLQLLIVLNLAHIFIMFLFFFFHIDNQISQSRGISRNDILVTYQINYNHLLSPVYSDNFPEGEKCSICLEDFDFNSNNAIVLTNCKHPYHENCIKEWLRIRTTCPNCAQNLVATYISDNF